ncbi:beta-ketoacyl synthase N-terminal-like domain-containing protein [Buchnera aphidicola]|uniref:beta-ketoacyl synthase N-terminal-like domain-containing protein n=1 Tax=Buchnera aphidicola TaxID=9 RepID=UPI002239119F|nr:beta-ketoacyl synthase N-terminal-like domain-containing protein [Buchnera aphidicola]MCW5197598.1 beta-ketoacyl-[acyl-carrier-protein] synthase I [Buchnera aphidicola (Chaitophorus viminalis)]
MKRVVITGIGLISSIGNNKFEVLKSLKNGFSGIFFSNEMKELGMKSNVWGKIFLNFNTKNSNKFLKYMNTETLFSYLAMKDAIKDSFLKKSEYQRNTKVGIIIGSGFCSSRNYLLNLKNKLHIKNVCNNLDHVNIYTIFKIMNSSISACLSTFFNIYGISYSISSACATSSNCIGHAYELIKSGKQDIMFAGGAEALTLETASYFDKINVLSKNFNDNPKISSRVYDINRDGFVISEGSGIIVLEELNSALLRNAHIYGEIISYSSNSNGYSLFMPSQKGIERCIKSSIKKIKKQTIECINVHATSTKIGDIKEINAIKKVFKNQFIPYISSTKSMTGHSLGASGVHEIIFLLLMLENNFIAPSINIKNLDPEIKDIKIITCYTKIKLNIVMSNSFGFGGVNTVIIFKKFYK